MSHEEYNDRSMDAVIARIDVNLLSIREAQQELHEKHDKVLERVGKLERWRWYLVGVFAAGGIGGGVTADVLGKILKSLSVLLVVVLFAGCASVPETVIRYDKQKEGVVISSPKDVEIARASIVVESNRIVRIDFEGYKAKNNIDVIRAVAERNQAALENAAKVGGALMGEVIGHMK